MTTWKGRRLAAPSTTHMRQTALSFLMAIACGPLASEANGLQVRPLTASAIIGSQVIVGRAHCAGVTWLLTDPAELTRVVLDALNVSSLALSGLRQGEKPWGLGCLPDGALWTLVAHDTLARLSAGGRVLERVRIDPPRVGIYSAGDRLLLQQPPAGPGKPLLTAGLPGDITGFVQWPAPLSQRARSLDEQMRSNLATCGIGVSRYVPCWLVNQTRIAIGDGTPAHTTVQDLRFVRAANIDEAAPIWDVALAGSSRLWVLASARAGRDGRRVGGRLTKSTRRAADEGFIDLNPSARVILWASEDRCVLLSVTGQVLEVFTP